MEFYEAELTAGRVSSEADVNEAFYARMQKAGKSKSFMQIEDCVTVVDLAKQLSSLGLKVLTIGGKDARQA